MPPLYERLGQPSWLSIVRTNRAKRIADLLVVTAATPLWLPLSLVIAGLVRIRMGRHVLFRQTRIGLHEQPFEILKFRTMTIEDDTRTTDNTPVSDAARITPLGRALRHLSLDEIPQLVNVLRGDMSIVGPRPLYPRYLAHYTQRERYRHAVRPGITGLAQVSGRNALLWEDRLETDVQYVASMSISSDVQIIARTVLRALRSTDISVVAGETGEPLDVHRSYPRIGSLSLRRFSIGDVPTRVEWMSHPDIRRHMQLPSNPSASATEDWFRATLADATRHDLTVFRNTDNSPVAMLGIKHSALEPYPELYVFVDPANQGRGIGRQSLMLLYQWLDESGSAEGTSLSVHVDNQAALSTYKHFGYTVDRVTGDRITMSLSVADWAMNA